MNSSRLDIREEFIALDTNEFHFALRRDDRYPACAKLLFERALDLRLHVPLQVLKELHRRLRQGDVRKIFDALESARECRFDYSPGDAERVKYREQQGARKGDAVIIAQMQAAAVPFLVSENRHFLSEVPNLPFEVLTAEEALLRLDSN